MPASTLAGAFTAVDAPAVETCRRRPTFNSSGSITLDRWVRTLASVDANTRARTEGVSLDATAGAIDGFLLRENGHHPRRRRRRCNIYVDVRCWHRVWRPRRWNVQDHTARVQPRNHRKRLKDETVRVPDFRLSDGRARQHSPQEAKTEKQYAAVHGDLLEPPVKSNPVRFSEIS